MSNDDKDSKNTSVGESKSQALADKLDLDKNPIQYATGEPGVYTTDAHDKPYMELTLRSGNHSELVQRLLRQRIEQRAKEFPRWPGEPSSGVRILWIESRFWYDRERMLPDFDDDWRAYRSRYIHSLELDPREPVHLPAYEKELLNPIRRFYMKGGDAIEKVFKLFNNDHHKTANARAITTRAFMGWVFFCGLYYWNRYNGRNWETRYGPYMQVSKPIIYPNNPRYPFEDPYKHPAQFSDEGFLQRKIFTDLRDYDLDNTVIL